MGLVFYHYKNFIMAKTFENHREDQQLPISIEQYNKEIDEAIARVEAGEYYTQAEIDQIAKDW
jgi:hypothetical protein